MYRKIKALLAGDSKSIVVAKMLPLAYKERLGVDFMECEDRTDPDAWGMGDAIALAEVKNSNSETGDFEFYFVIQDKTDEALFDRFRCKMNASIIDDKVIFATGSRHVAIPYPTNAQGLQQVLNLALNNKTQVPLK